MSQSRGRQARHLGTVRQSLPPSHLSPPPLKLDDRYEGISGNAMNLPPSKLPTEVLRKPAEAPTRQQVRSDSAPKAEKKVTKEKSGADKKLKETSVSEHDKALEQQIAVLTELIEGLKLTITEKDATISDLNAQLLAQNDNHRILLENEQSSHGLTKQKLESVANELDVKSKQIDELKERHANQVKDMAAVVKKCETEIAELKLSKSREIALRDEKLQRLKMQMADALAGNSKERHLQLEELSKELGKVQEEAELLKIKLKNSQKLSKERCSNCERLNEQLKRLTSGTRNEEKQKNNLWEENFLAKKAAPRKFPE